MSTKAKVDTWPEAHACSIAAVMLAIFAQSVERGGRRSSPGAYDVAQDVLMLTFKRLGNVTAVHRGHAGFGAQFQLDTNAQDGPVG